MTLKELEIITGTKLEYTSHEDGRVTVSLSRAEIQGGGFLISSYGRGKSVSAAEKDYARQLRGKTIVIDAYHPTRRLYFIPKTLKAK